MLLPNCERVFTCMPALHGSILTFVPAVCRRFLNVRYWLRHCLLTNPKSPVSRLCPSTGGVVHCQVSSSSTCQSVLFLSISHSSVLKSPRVDDCFSNHVSTLYSRSYLYRVAVGHRTYSATWGHHVVLVHSHFLYPLLFHTHSACVV